MIAAFPTNPEWSARSRCGIVGTLYQRDAAWPRAQPSRDPILASGDVMRIQLLMFEGCAHVAAARELLSRVLSTGPGAAAFEEVDTEAASTPERYRAYASPTILVDGEPIGGAARHGSCCRLYQDDAGRLVGVPSEAALRAALARAAVGRAARSPHAVA